MHRFLFKKAKNRISGRRVKGLYGAIDPEDIFLDSANLPGFEEHALEGRIERPMTNTTLAGVKIVLVVLSLLLIGKLWSLTILDGKAYAQVSERNRLQDSLVFA